MTRDYRQALRAKGIKPLKGKLRTSKKSGGKELCWDPREGFIAHEHEGEPEAPKFTIIRRAAA